MLQIYLKNHRLILLVACRHGLACCRNESVPAAGVLVNGDREGVRLADTVGVVRLDADLGVDVTPRHEILSVSKPAERSAGIKVESVDELLEKLRNEAKVIE